MGCLSSKDGTSSDGSGARPEAQANPKEASAHGMSHADFILDNKGRINEQYDIDKKKIGEGSYGTVCKAKHNKTKKIRAVKSVSKPNMKNVSRLKEEIAIMKMMDHPNIIKLYETFEDHRNIYLVMELCVGGELFDRIIEAGHFDEVKAAILMQQIIKAINYMHEMHVCHRDLKPENFLFSTKAEIDQNIIKIIDFGLSKKFADGAVLTTKAGTPYYVAPQVLLGKYDHLSDLWSCGVIMYVMLCGYPPFYGETDAEVLSKVRLGNFTFNAADWKSVSDDAKSLIRNLLKMNPKERYTAQQALSHVWIKNTAPEATKVDLRADFVDRLRTFRSQNKLKKAALHVIAGQLNDEQIKTLRETFLQLDGNNDGLLTIEEMKEGIKSSGLKELPKDLQEIMQDIDSDGSGVIDYTEFLAATLETRHIQLEGACWDAFRIFDKNGDGKIDQNELKHVLDNLDDDAKTNSAADLMREIDENGDGQISFEEFFAMMQKK